MISSLILFKLALKWYFYFYFMYFCLILVISYFNIRLGISEGFVFYMNRVFQYVSESRHILRTKHEEEGTFLPRNRSFITGNDIFSKLYTIAVLRNGDIPKYSSTIQRNIILLPEFEDDELYTKLQDNPVDDQLIFSKYSKNVYELSDMAIYIRAGIEALVEDQVTSRFEPEKLESWNLLTRNNPHVRFYNWKIALLWLLGLAFRYLILFPVRLLNCIFGISFLAISMTAVSYLSESKFKRETFKRAHLTSFHILARWLGYVIRFHNFENKPRNGIAVSNHTTPFDVLNLCTDNCYSLTGQKHAGFIGILERILSRASPHIWFDRSSISDREVVAKRLREHVNDKTNPPILIFPEGTCINNTAVTQFRKGAFEVGATIYPIAIKYDSRYGNAFWNSSKQSASRHVFEMMTSWSIVADVWYLPPVTQKANETSVQYANRVKSIIAKQMNVIDLAWDGQVKRIKPKTEWKELHKRLFYEKLKSRLRSSNT